MLNYENNNLDQRGTHSLVSARALLTLAQHGDDAAIYEHIDAYADNSALLGNLLVRSVRSSGRNARLRGNGTAGLAERCSTRARPAQSRARAVSEKISTARWHWPHSYPTLRMRPSTSIESSKRTADRVVGAAGAAIQRSRRGLRLRLGNALCVDQLIGFLRMLAPDDQARVGLRVGGQLLCSRVLVTLPRVAT